MGILGIVGSWLLGSFKSIAGAVWGFFAKYPLYCIMGLAIVALVFMFNNVVQDRDSWHVAAGNYKKALDKTVADFKDAKLEVDRLANENKAVVETKYVEIENAQDKDIRTSLANALSSLRAARDKANTSGPDTVSGTGPTQPAVDTAGTGQTPVMDDAEICTENTIKAEGWLSWFGEVRAVDRGNGTVLPAPDLP